MGLASNLYVFSIYLVGVPRSPVSFVCTSYLDVCRAFLNSSTFLNVERSKGLNYCCYSITVRDNREVRSARVTNCPSCLDSPLPHSLSSLLPSWFCGLEVMGGFGLVTHRSRSSLTR